MTSLINSCLIHVLIGARIPNQGLQLTTAESYVDQLHGCQAVPYWTFFFSGTQKVGMCLVNTKTILQVAVASEPAGGEGGQGSKDKRMPAPPIPAEVKQAVAIFKPYFDPDLFPRVSLQHPHCTSPMS